MMRGFKTILKAQAPGRLVASKTLIILSGAHKLRSLTVTRIKNVSASLEKSMSVPRMVSVSQSKSRHRLQLLASQCVKMTGTAGLSWEVTEPIFAITETSAPTSTKCVMMTPTVNIITTRRDISVPPTNCADIEINYKKCYFIIFFIG